MRVTRKTRKLMADIKKMCNNRDKCVTNCLQKNQQLERERDAAVGDIHRAYGYCKWFEINRGGNMTECHNPNGCRNISGVNTGFEWRGVKEE